LANLPNFFDWAKKVFDWTKKVFLQKLFGRKKKICRQKKSLEEIFLFYLSGTRNILCKMIFTGSMLQIDTGAIFSKLEHAPELH